MKKLPNGNKNAVVNMTRNPSFLHLINFICLDLTFQLAIGGGTVINSTDESNYSFEYAFSFYMHY